MHLKKKYGVHFGMMQTIANGQVFSAPLHTQNQIGKREAKFFFLTEQAVVW